VIEKAHDNFARLIFGEQRLSICDHGNAVAERAERTALAMGFTPGRARRIGFAGTLHDVGKTMISDAVLNKPGALSAREWVQVRRHPALGEQIVLSEGLTDIAPWVRSHHERYDGLGYPDRLVGDEIPVEARILSVADAFDAMVCARPYKAAIDEVDAAAELRRCAGTQFDPRVVAAFLLSLERRLPLTSGPAFFETALAAA